MVAERTGPLAVELASKLSYASCIRADEVHISQITWIACNGFWVVSQLFQVKSTINTLLVQKNMDSTTFLIGMSPPVKIQHCHLLFYKSRSILKTITAMRRRCIRADILVENCRNEIQRTIKATCRASKSYASARGGQQHSKWHHFRQFCWTSSKNCQTVSVRWSADWTDRGHWKILSIS